MSAPLRVYLIAGEPSGDVLGGRLITALKRLSPQPVEITGIGGPHMQEGGLESLFAMQDLTVMGLAEVVPRLPFLMRRIKETAEHIRSEKPDVIVTIDAPDFCFRVAKKVQDIGIPIVHYVAPSVWAWRPGRAKKVARLADHVLCLLPFEPPYFEREGMRATFVGHSILESSAGQGDGPGFRKTHGIEPEAPLLCVLPGSRMSEVSRLIDLFDTTINLLTARIPNLEIVVPTVDGVSEVVQQRWQSRPGLHIVTGDHAKYDAMAASSAALAASGTVSLELAIAGVPSVIGYRVSALTAAIAKRLLTIRFVSIPNLIAEREIMPEFLQEKCTAENLQNAVYALLQDENARAVQVAGLAETLHALRPASGLPSEMAAKVVLSEALGE